MPKAPSTLVPRIPITLTNQDQRDYAQRANSKTLVDWAQRTLQLAARGDQVNAWFLHAALDQALSANSTRHGASTVRRDRASEIRHLIYKVDAVLEAHLAGLQPVEPGSRSPRIAELERKVENFQARALAAEKRLTDELVTASDETVAVTEYLADLLTPDQARQLEAFIRGFREGAK